MGMSILIILSLSLKKHEALEQEFDGREGRLLYPKDRKVIIPFIF